MPARPIACREVKRLVRDVVEIGLRKAWHLDAAHLDVPPAEFLRRADLRVERVAGLVADSEESHRLVEVLAGGVGAPGFKPVFA